MIVDGKLTYVQGPYRQQEGVTTYRDPNYSRESLVRRGYRFLPNESAAGQHDIWVSPDNNRAVVIPRPRTPLAKLREQVETIREKKREIEAIYKQIGEGDTDNDAKAFDDLQNFQRPDFESAEQLVKSLRGKVDAAHSAEFERYVEELRQLREFFTPPSEEGPSGDNKDVVPRGDSPPTASDQTVPPPGEEQKKNA